MMMIQIIHMLTMALQPQVDARSDASLTADRQVDGIRACLALPVEHRADCLETSSRRLIEAIDRGSVVVRDARRPRDARERFGFEGHSDNDRAEAVSKQALPRINKIDGHITSVVRLPNGRWQFALEGGSVWVTLEAGLMFDPHVGDQVTINRGSFGSLRATFAGQSPLLVARRR